MDSNNKGGKVPLSRVARWMLVVIGVAAIFLGLVELAPMITDPEFLALFSGTIGSAMLCVAAIVDCTEKGKRSGKAVVSFKRFVAIGAVLVFLGAWALLFMRLEEILKIRFPF